MILRKPYAFLIKHFRLLHFIMFCLMAYVMYSSSAVMSFINEYLNSTMVLISHDVVTTLFPTTLFISIILIFILTIVILVLMRLKKKPIKFYLFNIATYIFTIAILIVSRNTLSNLELSLVEVRVLKLIQDFTLMTIMVEGLACIIIAIRATGFNIKKFDFARDMQELDVEDKDSEEFEVSLELETDRYLRKFRKIGRYIKYIYVENKFLFSIIGGIVFAILCIIIYLNMNIYNKVYKENSSFKTKEFYFGVTNTYVTNKDYKGNIIDPNYSFVITKVKLRTYSTKDNVLTVGRVALHVNDHNIYHTTDYRSEFSDLGQFYNGEAISNKFDEYILVFKIPNSYVGSKMMIYYFDTNFKTIKTKISPVSIDENSKTENLSLGQSISMNNSVLNNSVMNISNADLNTEFLTNYQICFTSNECVTSYEMIKPILNTNYDKSLLKIGGNIKFDDNLSIQKPENLYYFLEKFGSVSYTIDDKVQTINNLSQVIPNKANNNEVVYLELPISVMGASKISLNIKIRNCTYIYNLK